MPVYVAETIDSGLCIRVFDLKDDTPPEELLKYFSRITKSPPKIPQGVKDGEALIVCSSIEGQIFVFVYRNFCMLFF